MILALLDNKIAINSKCLFMSLVLVTMYTRIIIQNNK